MCVRISPSASGYERKAKPPTVMMTSSQKQKRKCYGQMWNDTSLFRRSTNNYLRIGSWRRWLLRFRRSRKTWIMTTLKRASPQTLRRSNHSKISKPLANHFVPGDNFYLVYHGIKNAKLINTNGPNILSRKTCKHEPFMHQTQGRMLDIIATALRVCV